MKKFYLNLPKSKKILFLCITILLSIPFGGFVGLILGLISTTFVPMCDNGVGGGHNCFEFRGMVGYEALGYIGFWTGAILIPIVYILLITRWEQNK